MKILIKEAGISLTIPGWTFSGKKVETALFGQLNEWKNVINFSKS